MKVSSNVKLEVEKFEDVALYCAHDCALGRLYDFSCALQSFVLDKIKETQAAQQTSPESPEKQKE